MNSPHSFIRRLPIGAEYQSGFGTHFRVWAPQCREVTVVVEGGTSVQLTKDAAGYFAGHSTNAKPGDWYGFKLDGSEKVFPDPASRFQPQGVHALSQIIDPFSFQWTDANWKGISAVGQVLYELHIGTFTSEGNWNAAAERLEELKELGITCIEVMPIAEFPGEYGWGYDGVDLFAPTRAYGSPDDLRRFIDRAHAVGLAVILDVVYNHIGPDGNYLKEYSEHYFTKKHSNDWGESLNFDDTGSEGVRDFFISNARHWIAEYHLDGFRFDATQAILDESPQHILAAITTAAREAAGERSIYLITENEPQQTQIVRPQDQGGYGMDALWNDDFHHSAMVALTGRSDAYFTDHSGKPQEFISCCKWGYLFQGQFTAWQMKHRGTPSLDLNASCFVNYIQNHDQIANYGHGERAHQLAGLAAFKAMTALQLLAPQTPMLFQGQEFAASSPFQYFADHEGELPELIRKGRLKELSQFPSHAHPEMKKCMRNPAQRSTFEACKIDWSQRSKGFHAQIYQLHKRLLKLRRDDPVFSRAHIRGAMDGAVIGPDAFVLRYFGDETTRLVLINLGSDLHLRSLPEPLIAPPVEMKWETLLSTESPQFGGCGIVSIEPLGLDWRLPGVNFDIPGRCAIVLQPIPLTAIEKAYHYRRFREREAAQKKGMAES